MMEKTQFMVRIPIKETRDEEEVKVHASSSREGKSIVEYNYHLAFDMVRMEILPSQRYNYSNLI